MNLAEVQQRVEDTCQYAPDILTYRRDIRRVISSVYEQLSTLHPWPWLQRTETIHVLPDIDIANAGISLTGPRSFTTSATTYLEGFLYPTTHSAAFEYWQDLLHGCEFDLATRTTTLEAGTGNWQFAPFVIERVTPHATTPTIHLDPRCNITALAAGLGNFVIRARRRQLPPRCDAVLEVLDDHDRPLTRLPTNLWRAYAEDPDREGQDPEHYLMDGGHEETLPWVKGHSAPSTAPTAETVTQISNQPIFEDPPFVCTAVNSGSNALLASTIYRFFVCWTYAGRYGPPSKIVECTTTASLKAVTLSSLPVQNNGAAGTDGAGDSGRRLAIFVAEGDHGPFFQAGIVASGITTSQTVSQRPTTSQLPMNLRRWETVYPNGPYTYLRFWPRPAETKTYKIRYLARPLPLVADVDEPELPPPFHKVLVHGTVLELITRYGVGMSIQQAQKRLYDEAMRAIYNRYLPQMDVKKQKGLFGAVEGYGPRHPTTLSRS